MWRGPPPPRFRGGWEGPRGARMGGPRGARMGGPRGGFPMGERSGFRQFRPTSRHSAPGVEPTVVWKPDDKFNDLKTLLESRYKETSIANKQPTALKKVGDIKKNITDCYGYIERLESLMNCLQLTYKSLPDDEWSVHCENAEKLKMEFTSLMKEIDIENPNAIEGMKKAVLLRKKKREYRKRKQKEWQKQKRLAKINSQQRAARINMWLEKMKDQIADAKREEDIKREADIVLADVLQKKTEAKKMLSLFNALIKLRTARAQSLPFREINLTHYNTAFNEIIERLKKIWMDQMNELKVEEAGLRVMLEHAEEERMVTEAAAFKKNLKAWSQGIFGISTPVKPLSVEQLIHTRHDWDKFICTDDTPMGTSIPIGWVLPYAPSSNEWAKFI